MCGILVVVVVVGGLFVVVCDGIIGILVFGYEVG